MGYLERRYRGCPNESENDKSQNCVAMVTKYTLKEKIEVDHSWEWKG